MSNGLGISVGMAVILVGLILLVLWWSMFIKALMAIVPLLLILIGAVALLYFISEMKSKKGIEEAVPSPAVENKPEGE